MAKARIERFKTLIEPEMRGLFRAAYRLAGNRSDAEDLVQETCLTAWEKLPAASATGHLDRWLFRVLTHRFIDGARRRRSGPVQPLNGAADPTPHLVSPDPGPADLAEQADGERRLGEAWLRLEPTQKVLLSLRAEGFGLAEIAEITGIGRDVLKARLHRARRRLARHLRDADESVDRKVKTGRTP